MTILSPHHDDVPDNWKDVKAPKVDRNIVRTYEEPSDTTPDKNWTVAEWSDGTFSCDCPSWTMSKKQRRRPLDFRESCKHIKRTMSQIGKVPV